MADHSTHPDVREHSRPQADVPTRRTAVVEQLVLPPLPTQPAARRRAIVQRGW